MLTRGVGGLVKVWHGAPTCIRIACKRPTKLSVCAVTTVSLASEDPACIVGALLWFCHTMLRRPRRRLGRLCFYFVAAAARATSSDEVEVLTLGAIIPPLLRRVRSSGSGDAGRPRAAQASLETEESPDQTIARLLNAVFEREGLHHLDLHDNDDSLDIQEEEQQDTSLDAQGEERDSGVVLFNDAGTGSGREDAGEGSILAAEDPVQTEGPEAWARDPSQEASSTAAEEGAATALESTAGTEDVEDFAGSVYGGGGDATGAAGIACNQQSAEKGIIEGELEAPGILTKGGAIAPPAHDTIASMLPYMNDEYVGAEEGVGGDIRLPAAKSVDGTHGDSDGQADGPAAATEARIHEPELLTDTATAAGMDEKERAVELVEAGGEEMLAEADAHLMEVGDTTATVVVHDTTDSEVEMASMGSHDDGVFPLGERDVIPAPLVPTTSVGDEQGIDGDTVERGSGLSTMESSGDSDLPREVSSDEVGVDAHVAVASVGADGTGESDAHLGDGMPTSLPVSDGSGVDASVPREPRERSASQHGGATTTDDVAASPATDIGDLATAPRFSSSEEAQKGNGEALPEASREDPRRKRPVFRFPEPLRSGHDPLAELALQLPPLPPIDLSPAALAEGSNVSKTDTPLTAEADYENGLENWGKESAAALRDAAVRWVRVATERGAVLAEGLLSACKAQVVQCWHDTIEPLTEHARRRLEKTANFCMAEVGAHLEDPALAEAL